MLAARQRSNFGIQLEIPLSLNALGAFGGGATSEARADSSKARKAQKAGIATTQSIVGTGIRCRARRLGQWLRRKLVVGTQDGRHVKRASAATTADATRRRRRRGDVVLADVGGVGGGDLESRWDLI